MIMITDLDYVCVCELPFSRDVVVCSGTCK